MNARPRPSAVTPWLFALATGALTPGACGAVFGDLPDVVVCSVDDPVDVLPWDSLVFYVSAHIDGGKTLYKSLTSNPVLLIIDDAGRVDAANLEDCDGLSADELRRRGRAFDFAPRG